jgi:hypothetical protein
LERAWLRDLPNDFSLARDGEFFSALRPDD